MCFNCFILCVCGWCFILVEGWKENPLNNDGGLDQNRSPHIASAHPLLLKSLEMSTFIASIQSAFLPFQKRTCLHPMFVGEIWSLHLLIKSPKSPWYAPDLLVTSPSSTRHALGPRRRGAGTRVAGKGWAHGQTDARRFHLLEMEMQLAWDGKISYKGWIELSKPQNRSDWRETIKHADLSINRRRFNMIAPTEIWFWIDFTGDSMGKSCSIEPR